MLKLINFSDSWKKYFEQEKALLLDALQGQQIEEIEHIGATSVLLCKTCGTIDLLCSINNKIDFITIKNILVRKKYQYIDSLSEDECLVFVRRNENNQIVSTIRLVEQASLDYKKIILFKFYLRENHKHVKKYNEFRKALLEQCSGDAKAYQKTKKSYIESILNDFCRVE